MKLMIDQSVLFFNKTEQWRGEYFNHPNWHPNTRIMKQIKIDHLDKSQRIRDDISAIKALAKHYSKEITYCSYSELIGEHWRSNLDTNATYILDYSKFENLECPIDRSYLTPVPLSDMASKEKFVAFIKLLLQRPSDFWATSSWAVNLTPFHMQCLKSFDDFRAVCKSVDDNHLPDLFHLWTTWCHNLDGFLTMDYKLIRLYENTLNTPTVLGKPISPSGILKSVTA